MDKIERLRHASNKEKLKLLNEYYKNKSFRDTVRSTPSLSWIAQAVFALTISSTAPLQTIPIIPITSTMAARFFNNEYILNYDNTTGNPTDYTRYNLVMGIDAFQPGGQGGNNITFRIEVFELDGVTPAVGPFFYMIANGATNTDPTDLGIGPYTEAEMLTLNPSISVANSTILTQSNDQSSNLASSSQLPPAAAEARPRYFMLNNNNIITLTQTNIPENGSLTLSINGYLMYTIPKSPNIAVHGSFSFYKKKNQRIRITHILPTIPSIVTQPVIPLSTTTGERFFGGLSTQTWSNAGFPGQLTYQHYVLLNNMAGGTTRVTMTYNSVFTGGTVPFTEGIAFAFGLGSLAPTNPITTANGITDTEYKNITYSFIPDQLVVTQHNNPSVYTANKNRQRIGGVNQPIVSRNPYFQLNNGDRITFIFAPNSFTMLVNGYVVVDLGSLPAYNTLSFYKRDDQQITLTIL